MTTETIMTDDPAQRLADDANANVNQLLPRLFPPNPHPDAQWFPRAGLGLFMHWGIHSVAGVQPSWVMMDRCPSSGKRMLPDDYYQLAGQFDPQNYDPDRWIAAAAKAGFTYAVLTTKHHDGYTLWPSAVTRYGTHSHMNSRDLLEPYVDACRRHGLKVGFYFSQRDWSHPLFPMATPAFDYPAYKKRADVQQRQTVGYEPDQAVFDEFFEYTMAQIRELLTRYGKIDVLWFDSCDWPGVDDRHLEARKQIRVMMPGIAMNERWGQGHTGDFSTWECRLPEARPAGWWEACAIWDGHWGYNPRSPLRTNAWLLDRLTGLRGWGGNLLVNVGPAPDGTMKPAFYRRCEELAEWMQIHGEAVRQVNGLPEHCQASHAVTVGNDAWYIHIPSEEWPLRQIAISPLQRKPARAIMMRTGFELNFDFTDRTLTLNPTQQPQGAMGVTSEVDVIKLLFDEYHGS